MDIFNSVVQAVGSVGFPIVCCIYMIKTLKDIQDVHRQETDDLRKVVENNTLTVTKLYEKIDLIVGKYGKE